MPRFIIHISVGYLSVARSDRVGNAKASISGTSDRYRFPRFFFMDAFVSHNDMNRPIRGICGHNVYLMMLMNNAHIRAMLHAELVYNPPVVEVFDVAVELGFASSGTDGNTEPVSPENGIW